MDHVFFIFGIRLKDVFKEIKRLKARKSTQVTDISVKIISQHTIVTL